MLNIYALTCVNEDLILVRPPQLFSTDGGAYAELQKQYDRERTDIVSSGFELSEDTFDTFEAKLVWGSDNCCYYWQITKCID